MENKKQVSVKPQYSFKKNQFKTKIPSQARNIYTSPDVVELQFQAFLTFG